jgi:hypothetical protein
MKRTSWIVLLAAQLAWAVPAGAQQGLGLGVIVGEPTGLSLKTWMSRATAFDFAAAWSFADEGSLHLHGDYLLHSYGVIRVEKGSLPLYYGIGGRVRALNGPPGEQDEVNVGVRIPVGLAYLFQNDPFELFLEVVPILDITPASDVTLNASLGCRYYFQ